jgi:hypothetical protein
MVRESSTCPSVEGAISSLPSACCTWALRGGCAKEGCQPFARPCAHTDMATQITLHTTICVHTRNPILDGPDTLREVVTQHGIRSKQRSSSLCTRQSSTTRRCYPPTKLGQGTPTIVCPVQDTTSVSPGSRTLSPDSYFTVRCRFCAKRRQEPLQNPCGGSKGRAPAARPFPGRLSPPRASLSAWPACGHRSLITLRGRGTCHTDCWEPNFCCVCV